LTNVAEVMALSPPSAVNALAFTTALEPSAKGPAYRRELVVGALPFVV
jgi:hypothetical protein